MKRGILVILLAIVSLGSMAQIKISGTVRLVNDGSVVQFVNVLMQKTDLSGMYSYAMTNEKGEYSFNIKVAADSVALTVTGMNIKPITKLIAAKSQRVDFVIEEKVTEIREVIVEGNRSPVRRGGDTLTYAAARYIDANDVAIEDVIKKLPGVDVEESGTIKYQGKEISRFYVEGLDMLGGRYSIASKNIAAEDVKDINIYENHQHIKALKEISRPDNAAMNITLKEEAKGTWTGSILAGVGYEPWMWKGEASAMYFGKKMQSINTYKTNNMGEDVAQQSISHFDGTLDTYSIIGVQLPTTPPLAKELYLNNNVHSISSNFLFKLSENTQLKLNAGYTHDLQESEGVSTTTHNIVGAAPIVVNEATYAQRRTDKATAEIEIENNREKNYIKNKTFFTGDFNEDYGRVLSNDEMVEQDFTLPSLSARNNLQLIFPVAEKLSFNIRSDISYNNQPNSLKVSPMLFPEVFGLTNAQSATQTLNSSKFVARNSLFTSFRTGNWDFSVALGANAHVEDMTSELFPLNNRPLDPMRNDINWQRYDFTVGPSVGYKIGEKFSAFAYIYTDFMSLNARDKVRENSNDISRIILCPSLRLNGQITQDLKYSASASYNEYYGGLYDSYGGFIMTDYRNIATKDGELSHTKSQNYSASLTYSNALDLLFANLDGSYWVSDRNITYAYNYDGALTYIESVAAPNRSHGYNLSGKVSKQFLSISTLFTLGGGWSRSWSEIIRQGDLLGSQSDLYSATFGFNTRFCKWLTMHYEIEANRSVSKVEKVDDLAPIDFITQNAELLFTFSKKFTATINTEHYYNGTLSPEYRNMVFLGATLKYSAGKFDYMLEGRNLLGTDAYSSAFTSDITDYRYSYALNPRAIIATVRFKF